MKDGRDRAGALQAEKRNVENERKGGSLMVLMVGGGDAGEVKEALQRVSRDVLRVVKLLEGGG